MDPEFLTRLARPQITMEVRHIPDSETDDDVVAVNPVDSLIALGFNYNDMDAALARSSSPAAAPSSSSAGYFVDEPDPEPEPEGP